MCVSRILRKRIEELDENCIIQPGRDIPKEQYVRRRAFTKKHKTAWEAALEKYKHIKCIFQNCHFLALSVEDMISHFGYCNGDGSFARFICPYCEGRVTSEKILGIHIRRSHEYEHYGIINNHFLDIGDDATGSVQCENKPMINSDSEFETVEENMVVDVKIEEMGSEYSEGMVTEGIFIADNDAHTGKSLDYEDVNSYENEFDSGQETDVEGSILPDEQNEDAAKQGTNQGKGYRGDHIYFKRMGTISSDDDCDSLLVMKNTNIKHYSGPRNVTDRTVKGEDRQGGNCEKIATENNSSEKQKSDSESDKYGKLVRQMIKFSFPSVQNTRRKVHQSYTNTWNQSIKKNGFARCLVATCNFISLDIFHIQNHFKTCNGAPANGPNLCTICNSWLPSAIELTIHSERCKIYRALTDTQVEVVNDAESDVIDKKREEKKPEGKKESEDLANEVVTVPDSDSFQLGQENKNGTTETVAKKEKTTTLRISDIIKLKDNGNMDINRIIQPGPVLPKDQYLRRRAYTRQHKAIWEAALEKHKYVKCIFQNCHFVAMSLEDMIYHFGYCIGDGSFARFQCPHCNGRLTTKMVLDIHIKMSHPEVAADECEDDSEEMSGEYGTNVDNVLPSVEEMKKLVNSREIKTYGRNSTRSKRKNPQVKCEPQEWCPNSEGPLSCVTVVLEENQSGLDSSESGGEIITVEPDLVPNISNRATSDEDIDHESCNFEQTEECSGINNKSVSESRLNATDTPSECEKDSGKVCTAESALVNCENDIVKTRKKSLVGQDDSRIKDGNKMKNNEDLPQEVDDPGTNDQRSVEEGGKTSEEKPHSNGESAGGGRRTKGKTEGGESNSSTTERTSRRRGRPSKSSSQSRGESESKETENENEKSSKRKAEETEGDEESKAEASPKIARVEPVEDEGGTKPPRRRGRPPKKSSAARKKPVRVDEPIREPVPDVVKKGKRGRKRKNQEETEEVVEEADNSEVKCAKCDFRTKRQRFSDHNFKKHVGLSWIEGETPIDPNDEETISYSIKQAFKVIKSATCELCNCVKKSALGFVSHVQNCGKSEEEKEALKVTCPHCPSRVLKYSLPMHLKLSHSDSPGEGSKAEEESELLTKRRSAIRAANKFQEVLKNSDDEDDAMNKALYVLYEKGVSKFPKLPYKIRGLWKKFVKAEKKIPCRREGCLVESTTVQDARRHHFTCPQLPEKSYMCQQCDYYSATEENMREHVNIHPNTDGDFTVGSEEEKIVAEEVEMMDAEDADDFIKNKSRTSDNPLDALEAVYKMKFFVRENLLNGRQTRFCRQSLRMTLSNELEEVEDAALPLSELRTNTEDWVGVSLNSVHNYLPSLEESMSFYVTRNTKMNGGAWKKLGRFEGVILEGASVIFTGGSVLAMSWCRYSCVRSFKENPRQYLAVSSSKEMRKFQDIHEAPVNLFGCIQIWDCGVLNSTPEIPKMMLGIIHDSGQVWDLAWFPRDTFEESAVEGGATRIGLLGAACQDGTVRVWSICDPQKLKSKFRVPLYRTEPRVILQLENSESSVGCLRLAVGKTGVIVGGYANGMAAVWNLKAISSPFCRKVGKTFILKPHVSFQAHRTSITALSICPNSDRYIATSGLDRFLRLWDLECVANPIESTIREVCLDNAWPQHWPLTISTFEDIMPCTGKGMVKAIRDAYCDKHRAPITMDNTCWSLSINDWMNAICASNSRGDVKIRFMRNMFMADEKFRLRTGHLFSTTDLKLLNGKESDSGSDDGNVTVKKKSKGASTVPRTYEEGRRYFGLIFNDYIIRDDAKVKSEVKPKKGSQCMDEYPITSVNKVCWNPNYGSFKFLAVGHQTGFVRIRELEDTRCEEEMQRFFRDAEDIIVNKV